MKISTKRGDRGSTTIYGGRRLSKCDLRIQVQGALDEAISCLGFARTKVRKSHIKDVLRAVQKNLFRVIGEIANSKKSPPGSKKSISAHQVKQLENIGNIIENRIKLPISFVIPGVNEESASLHMARCVVRRAECLTVALNEKSKLNPHILEYLNRLSDLLFLLAISEEGESDVLKDE